MPTRSLRSVVTCGVLCLAGCAAAQVDEMPDDSGTGNKPSNPPQGGSGGGSGGTGAMPKAGSPSAAAGTTAKAGSGSGGSGTAGQASGGSGGSGGTKPVKPANTNLPYSEDFEDGEPNGFIPWNEDVNPGMWAVVDDPVGKVYQPAGTVGELEFAVGGSTDWTDVKLTVKVRIAAESEAQILVRMQGPKTYLVVEMAEGKFKLRGRTDGSTVDLVAPSPKPVITPGMWHEVSIVAKGTAVELILDGTSIGTAAAQAEISNGGIGLGVAEGTVSYDDVSVVVAE